MERRMVDQRERMAREFQEEVRRRQEQEERNQEQEDIKEHKKSTTLVPNSPPVPALRDRIKKEEEDAREKEEKKVMETATNREVKRKDQDESTAESRGQEEQTFDVVGKLVWADKIFLRSNSIK